MQELAAETPEAELVEAHAQFAEHLWDQTMDVLQRAAEALANLALDPLARDEIVGDGDGMTPLVRLLQGDGRSAAKASTAKVLARLAKDNEATQAAIQEAGAIPTLATMLAAGADRQVARAAASALSHLADDAACRAPVIAAIAACGATTNAFPTLHRTISAPGRVSNEEIDSIREEPETMSRRRSITS